MAAPSSDTPAVPKKPRSPAKLSPEAALARKQELEEMLPTQQYRLLMDTLESLAKRDPHASAATVYKQLSKAFMQPVDAEFVQRILNRVQKI
jgi:hypothetical protein